MTLHGKIYKNKYWELETYLTTFISIFYFSINWSIKGDHAGFSINIEIFKWAFSFKIYDNRHWNWNENRFYLENEEDYEDRHRNAILE
jgi:hypothetical protein